VGTQMVVQPSSASSHFFDCYHGKPLTPIPGATLNSVGLNFTLEGWGYGCVVETAGPAGTALGAFLSRMANLTKLPLANFSSEWKYELQAMVPIPPTSPAKTAPNGMVLVPHGNFTFATSGIEIEGDDAHGVDVQFPWEDTPRRAHSRVLEVPPFYIHKYPVTNKNYSDYLAASGYSPRDPAYWLKNWELAPPPQLSYVAHEGIKCFGGHGAKDIDGVAHAAMTSASCQERCSADRYCECVVFEGATGSCWKRAQCMAEHCDADPDTTTFFKQAPAGLATQLNGSNLKPPAHLTDVPVTYVSLNEARQYCKWAKGRLPHVWEWQYAAQGTTGYKFPWGPTKGSVVPYAPDGAIMPSTSVDDFEFSGGAAKTTFRSDARCSGSNIRSGNPGLVSRITLANPLLAPGYTIESVTFTFRWIAGYSGGNRSSTVSLLLMNSEGKSLATLFTSPPLSNYSYDTFTQYSPPVRVAVSALSVPNDELVYVVLEVTNNDRNLQFPVDDLADGFGCTIHWQPAASGGAASFEAPSDRLSVQERVAPPANYPALHSGTTLPGAESVHAHPSGASPFGVQDLVGNVWQYTSEFYDNHTRYVILRGGSNYRPAGSHWYFPNQMELNTHQKYFLMDDTYERAGTVGFRCVVDFSEGERSATTPPNFPTTAL